MLAAVGVAAFACGIATGVGGRPAADPPPGRDRTRWGAQIDALMTAKLHEVSLSRQVARNAQRAALRREAAQMQLEAQQTLLRLDTAYRRLLGTAPTASGGDLGTRGPGPGRGRASHQLATSDSRRLAALIAARTRAAGLAMAATGNPAFGQGGALGRLAGADRAAAVRLAAWRGRWSD